MILAAFLIALQSPIAYDFPVGTPRTYDVSVHFRGYVPLFGGQPDADVEVKLKVTATGLAPGVDGNPQVTNEIQQINLLLGGNELPIQPESVTRFFPKSTISMSPQGEVLKNDAPDAELPIKLPGLHVRRFPDITYVPIQFPVDGIEMDKPFTFTKLFGDSHVKYTVTPTAIGQDTATFNLKVHQDLVAYEDELGNAIAEADAKVKVTTVVDGAGVATFDRKRSIVSEFKLDTEAISEAVELKEQKKSARKLKTTLTIKATQS